MCVHPRWVQTDMGGSKVLLTLEESAVGVLEVMTRVEEEDSGNCFSYTGDVLQW